VAIATEDRLSTQGGQREALIDADVHLRQGPTKYLPERFRNYKWASRQRSVVDLPRARAFACRSDSWPPSGGIPGSDLAFAADQTLNEYGASYGIQNTLGGASPAMPRDYAIASVRATNQWAAEELFEADPRWRASLMVTTELDDAAVAEIEHWADEKRFVQVLLAGSGITEKPLGDSKYWAIYEACEALGLPVAVHNANGSNDGGSGWASYYFEDHTGFIFSNTVHVASLVFEGVFERFPKLQFVTVEGGWSWAIALGWRLDSTYRVMREEVPALQRKPSEYTHEHVWHTTQPMEEPEHLGWLPEALERSGVADRLMFSTDYPHWDFDSPDVVIPDTVPEETRQKIYYRNASRLYGLTVDVPSASS
jgi:predicted TIM-barrel fold metal-dependent hydrolase